MNIIFLDFEGVLDGENSLEILDFLNTLSKSNKETKIVFSSNKKRIIGWISNIEKFFKKNNAHYIKIIGSTPTISNNNDKAKEINNYLVKNKVDNYIIIDDCDNFYDFQKKHLILIKNYIFSNENKTKCFKILNGENNDKF